MLGIPLLTAKAGFLPAMGITIVAWAIMLWTGLLYLEATLWMPVGSNLLSMSKRFLGEKGRWFSGTMFLFLYYCLLVAYFAGGAPMVGDVLSKALGIHLSGVALYALFGGFFALIVALGAKWIDRTNMILTVGLILSYIFLICLGAPQVNSSYLKGDEWPVAVYALPVLFSAFGYHNIIPSLVTYFGKEKKALKLSIILGTVLALFIYLIWQWLVIGIVPMDKIAEALKEGKPVTAALQHATGKVWIFLIGQAFAFFALTTSLIGVAFSVVDFLADGMKINRHGWRRFVLSAMTFFPPFVMVTLYPTIFDKALGIAGGIGEAILNGLIPVAFVWVGRYFKHLLPSQTQFISTRLFLSFISCMIIFVMILEIVNLSLLSR